MRNAIEDYAIVIGIDRYKNFNFLQDAERDARAFADWLISPETSGGRLPVKNVRLFLSTPTTGFGSPVLAAEKWSIERTMSEFGVQGGARVGRRLTFYFAGYSYSLGSDDIGLIVGANAEVPLGVISLKAYQRFFQEFAPFNEVVFILDTQLLIIPSAGFSSESLPFTASRRRESAPEVAFFSVGYHRPDGKTESRLRLTPILLEGLQNRAAVDPDGRITATSLGRYLTTQVNRRSARADVERAAQVIISQVGEIVFDNTADEQVAGTLLVELPHWTAELSLYDSRLRKISDGGTFREAPTGSGAYQAEISLPKGVYQVQASLEDESETQIVLLHAGKTTTVNRDSWKSLALKSAAPLAEVSIRNKAQIKHAEKKSLKSTWTDHPSGDSRLFLFLRTETPEKFSAFDQGLRLLDADGELITDFSDGVKRKTSEGWMAFNAKLPSGYYILRRGREGVRLRQQGIYLCANWETHVFLLARNNFPSLSTMAMDMSPLGEGFHPDDAAAAAAESVLWSLRPGMGDLGLVGSERLRMLLDRKKINPWLGILASYVLSRASLDEASESAALLKHVLAYLKRAIPDHPDVSALHLKEDQPTDKPFWNPPLLRAGLERVQTHAIRFADTIALDSLCDVVLDNFILNTPWTAWRQLDRNPISRKGATTKGLRPGKTKTAALPLPSLAQSIVQAASPTLPVYKLSESRLVRAQQDPTTLGSAGTAGIISQAAFLQQVQALTATTNFDDRPESAQVDLRGVTDDLLNNINPADVSDTCGVPLARAQRGLQELRQKRESASTLKGDPAAGKKALSSDEQVVIYYAVQQQASRLQTFVNTPPAASPEEGSRDVADAPGSSTPRESDETATKPTITIEEIALSLQTESDRLLVSRESTAEQETARALSERLKKQAKALQERAYHVVLTDRDGHIISSNGAFLLLISAEELRRAKGQKARKSSASQVAKQRQKNQRLWEKAIKALEPGATTLKDPLHGSDGPTWAFKRTTIQDETGIERSHLYAFRKEGAADLGSDALNEIAGLLAGLTFNCSMFAYGTGKEMGKSLSLVEEIVSKLETIIQEA